MNKTIQVNLTLTDDGPNTIDFTDTYEGLDAAWYKFESDQTGNINLWANQEGYEHLARYFLKLARTKKAMGFHCHHALDGEEQNEGPELTITLCDAPDGQIGDGS